MCEKACTSTLVITHSVFELLCRSDLGGGGYGAIKIDFQSAMSDSEYTALWQNLLKYADGQNMSGALILGSRSMVLTRNPLDGRIFRLVRWSDIFIFVESLLWIY